MSLPFEQETHRDYFFFFLLIEIAEKGKRMKTVKCGTFTFINIITNDIFSFFVITYFVLFFSELYIFMFLTLSLYLFSCHKFLFFIKFIVNLIMTHISDLSVP